MENIFTSTEFYIIAITLAILLFGFMFHPSNRGEAITYFFEGNLEPCNSTEAPHLQFVGEEDKVLLIRHANMIIPRDSSVNIAMTIVGTDLRINEKVVVPKNITPDEIMICDVEYRIDKLLAQRYHVYFEDTSHGTYASTNIFNDEGFKTEVAFKL